MSASSFSTTFVPVNLCTDKASKLSTRQNGGLVLKNLENERLEFVCVAVGVLKKVRQFSFFRVRLFRLHRVCKASKRQYLYFCTSK